MSLPSVPVTGSCGLIGPEVCLLYAEENRAGDHICYYTDLRKVKSHYPAWGVARSLPAIFREIAGSWMCRLSQAV